MPVCANRDAEIQLLSLCTNLLMRSLIILRTKDSWAKFRFSRSLKNRNYRYTEITDLV
jgi:hypothetical protein